jgi:PTS system fructose-specific IIC component
MAGSAATGALSFAFGATSRAPHGGIWVVGLIGRPGLYLLAIATGVLVSAAAVVGLKSVRRTVAVTEEQPQDVSVPVGPGAAIAA